MACFRFFEFWQILYLYGCICSNTKAFDFSCEPTTVIETNAFCWTQFFLLYLRFSWWYLVWARIKRSWMTAMNFDKLINMNNRRKISCLDTIIIIMPLRFACIIKGLKRMLIKIDLLPWIVWELKPQHLHLFLLGAKNIKMSIFMSFIKRRNII